MQALNIIQETYAWNPNVPLTKRDLNGVIVRIMHHSDSDLTTTVQDIHQEHLAKNWHGIGYNAVIYPDGSIHTGTPWDCVPAATEGFNTKSIAICLIGDFEPGSEGYTGRPTQKQLDSFVQLCAYLQTIAPNIANTKGHRDFNQTACPGQNAYDDLPTLRSQIENAIKAGKG